MDFVEYRHDRTVFKALENFTNYIITYEKISFNNSSKTYVRFKYAIKRPAGSFRTKSLSPN